MSYNLDYIIFSVELKIIKRASNYIILFTLPKKKKTYFTLFQIFLKIILCLFVLNFNTCLMTIDQSLDEFRDLANIANEVIKVTVKMTLFKFIANNLTKMSFK